MIPAAKLARDAIEEPIPGREVTPHLISEIRTHCNLVCDESVRRVCAVYGKSESLQHCEQIKLAEKDLRRRAGC